MLHWVRVGLEDDIYYDLLEWAARRKLEAKQLAAEVLSAAVMAEMGHQPNGEPAETAA